MSDDSRLYLINDEVAQLTKTRFRARKGLFGTFNSKTTRVFVVSVPLAIASGSFPSLEPFRLLAFETQESTEASIPWCTNKQSSIALGIMVFERYSLCRC